MTEFRQQLRAEARAQAFQEVSAQYPFEPRRARRRIARAWAKAAWRRAGLKAGATTAAALALLLCSIGVPSASGQGSRKDDIVLNARGTPLAGATIRVCALNATGQPCAPLALIYSDAALTQAKANPTTTDGLGNYNFYAAPGRYMIEISGPGITTRQIPDVILPSDPTNSQFNQITVTNGVTAFSLTLTGNLTVAGSASVTGAILVTNGAGAATPSSGQVALYTKSADKKLYYKDDAGAETGPLGPGGHNSADAVEYVTPSGNDANDGLSWRTAKGTIYAALKALPGGDATHAGGGAIFVSSSGGVSVPVGGPVGSQGIWIMGPADPNFASPPSGWLKETGAVSIIAEGAGDSGANSPAGPTTLILADGSATNKPALWLSGVGFRYLFRRLAFRGAVAVRIGVDSNGSRTSNAGAAPTTFQNCDFRIGFTNNIGTGPVLDLGPNIIWLWIDHASFESLGQQPYTISSVSRSSNVVTVTLSSGPGVPFWQVGQEVVIGGVTDKTFNGRFAIASVASATSFTYAQTASNASSSGGTASLSPNNDNRASILFDTTGGGGSGLIHVEDAVFNGGGGVRFRPSSGSSSFYMRNVEMEGSANTQPIFEAMSAIGGATTVWVENVGISDSGDNPPYVRTTPDSLPDAVRYMGGPQRSINGVEVVGPARILNAGANGQPVPLRSTDAVTSPAAQGQIGTNLHQSFYQHNDARRAFGPALALYANQAAQLTSAWTTHQGTVSITTGKRGPDATTNAALVSTTADSGGFSDIEALSATHVFTAGDYLVAGVWAKLSPIVITSTARSAGIVTVTTSTNHQFATNDVVSIYGVAMATGTISLNGNFTVASTPTGTTFTIAQGGADGTGTGGFTTEGVYFNPTNPTLEVDFPFASSSNITIAKGYGSNAVASTTSQGRVRGSANAYDDGGWQWVWAWAKVGTTDGSAIGVHFQMRADTKHPMLYMAPTLMYVPASDIASDSEAAELAMTLSAFPDGLSAGVLATLRKHPLAFGGSGDLFHGILDHTALTANRTYTFQDTSGTVAFDNVAQTWSGNQTNVALVTPSIGGETISASPRMSHSAFLPGALTSTWTAATLTLDKAITVTRVQVQPKTAPASCTTNAVVRLSDGSTTQDVTITAAANDSGAISKNYAAAAALTIAVQTAAAGCTTSPADANVVVQYRLQ